MDKLTFEELNLIKVERMIEIIRQLAAEYDIYPLLKQSKEDPTKMKLEKSTQEDFETQLHALGEVGRKKELTWFLKLFNQYISSFIYFKIIL